jgi:hypothetical protein
MKTILFSICVFICVGAKSQTAEEVVSNFFKALSAKDAETIDRLTLDDMHLHSLMLGDDTQLSSTTKTKFIEGLKSIPEEVNIEERIFDVQSLISEDLAQFQVPYQFYVNGKSSHSGINVLSLLNTKDGWKISYIADTRIK